MSVINNSYAQIVTTRNYPLQAWCVCLSASLFFFYELLHAGIFNSLAPYLMDEFHIDATHLGYLSASYFYADILFSVLAGVIIDRFSVRKIILSAAILSTLATFMFAISYSIIMIGISHFLSGIGNAFCFLSCMKLSSRWFSSKQLGFVIGLIITIAMTGGIVAQSPLTALAQNIGWRHAVLLNGLLGILIFFINWYFIIDYPSTYHQTLEQPQKLSKIRLVLFNPQNWLCGAYACLLNLPIFLLGDLWGVLYFVQVHHLSHLEATYITTMIFVGIIIGSPLVGWFSDKIESRRLPMILGGFFSLALIFIIIYLSQLTFFALLILLLLLGISTSTQILSYPSIIENNPKALTSTSISLASILIMGGGAVFQPLFGLVMDFHNKSHLANHVAVYNPENFFHAMLILPIAFAIGTLSALFIRKSYLETIQNRGVV